MTDFMLLYIDASGDPGPFNGSNSTHYTIACYGISYQNYKILSAKMKEVFNIIKDKTGVEVPEVKTRDLIRKSGIYKGLSPNDQQLIIDKIIETISSTNPTIISVVFDKASYYRKLTFLSPSEIKLRAMNYLVDRIDRFLSRRNALGILIYDYEGKEDKHYRKLIRELKVRGSYSIPMQAYRPLQMIVDTVMFVPSEAAYGIQIADFIAYITYGHVANRQPSATIFKRIEEHFDKDPSGNIKDWGLKIIK